jgi:hypothetical protein
MLPAVVGGASMRNALAAFFTSSVTILRATVASDAYGEELPTWAVLTDHAALPAIVAHGDVSIRMKRQEFRTSQATSEMEYRRVLLKGNYPLIKRTDRCRVDGVDWAIISIASDVTTTFTELLIETIETGNI